MHCRFSQYSEWHTAQRNEKADCYETFSDGTDPPTQASTGEEVEKGESIELASMVRQLEVLGKVPCYLMVNENNSHQNMLNRDRCLEH